MEFLWYILIVEFIEVKIFNEVVDLWKLLTNVL